MRVRTKTNYHKLSLGNTNKYFRHGVNQKMLNILLVDCINQFSKDISVSQHCLCLFHFNLKINLQAIGICKFLTDSHHD